ncbi:MAG: LysM peptidoglycan-binding domain-containing protein [Patescibacteria group bacterium]
MRSTSTIYRFGLVLLAVIILNLAPARILAIEGNGVSVFPAATNEYPGIRSWFVYEAEPGKEIKDKVLIKNHSNSTVTLKVAVLDGAVTKDGGYTLVGGVEENKDVGTWSTLSRNSVTLPPQSQQTIDLTVKVPLDADVGSHPGGVVIWEDKTATAGATKSAGQLSVVTRVAARLYLTVPGDIIRKLRIENVHHTIYKDVLYFQMTMHNDGNVQLTPKADVKLRGIFGSAGEQLKSQFGMILRGGTIQAKIPWQKHPPKFGRFVADFRIHYGEEDFKGEYVKDEYQDIQYVFWLIPWLTMLWWLIGLALLLLIRKFWLWIVIRQRLNTKTKEHTVKKGETLTTIAGIYNIDPKKIAKFNLLKWPYDLLVGDILLIPQGQMTKVEQKAQSSADKEALRRGVEEPIGKWFKNIFRHRPNSSGRHAEFTPVLRNSESEGWISASPRKILSARPGKRARLDSRQARQVQDEGSMVDLEPVIAEVGDTVKTVAEFAEVSAKEIIAINKLKWPYKLQAGQELFIPVPPVMAIKKSSGASRLAAKKTVKRRPPKRSK